MIQTVVKPTRRGPSFDPRTVHSRTTRLTVCAALCLVLGACVAGSHESAHAAGGGDISQFLLGLWHGIIAPVMLIVEIINRVAPHALSWTVRFYETRDTNVVYDIGFFIGLVGSPVFIGSRWPR